MSGYLQEESYELLDAVESDNVDGVCEEIGDVLFHLLFIIACYEEKGDFNLDRVIRGIVRKMTRRHPHVFGGETLDTPEAVREQWGRIKAREKKSRAGTSVLDSVPRKQPALMRAFRISERAADVKFDWEDIHGVMEKVEEEWHEFKAEAGNFPKVPQETGRMVLEFGDLLFSLVNLARFIRIAPESALHASTNKFEERFRFMENRIAENNRDIREMTREEKDAIWKEAKDRFA